MIAVYRNPELAHLIDAWLFAIEVNNGPAAIYLAQTINKLLG